MNISIISAMISAGALLIGVLTFVIGRTKDHDAAKENNIKINIKLDQLCTNTNQLLVKQEQQEHALQQTLTDMAVLRSKFDGIEKRVENLERGNN